MVEQHSESKTERTPWIAIWALVGVNALWGLSFPIMRSLNLQMEHFFGLDNDSVPSSLSVAFSSGMIGMRFLVAFLLLFVVCPNLVRRASKSEWRAGVLVGLLFYVGLVLQVMGLATIPASRSGFLTSLTAVFTPVFSAVLFRKSISTNVFVGILIALLGVSILTGLIVFEQGRVGIAVDATSKWTLGDSLTTLGAILFTGQLLLVDYYGKRINTTAITPGMFLAVTIAATLTFVSLHSISLSSVTIPAARAWSSWCELLLSPVFLVVILFLALFCSVLAFLGMNKYQPHITAVQASIIYSSEPVFASLWALFIPEILGNLELKMRYPNEVVSLPLFVGGACVLFANVVALWPRNPNR
jgi:drug/metabolite transporter (DMT)-like permease